jgi:hypothetical protein
MFILNPDQNTGYPDVFSDFPHLLLINSEVVPPSGHERFLANPFQIINHLNIPCSIIQMSTSL